MLAFFHDLPTRFPSDPPTAVLYRSPAKEDSQTEDETEEETYAKTNDENQQNVTTNDEREVFQRLNEEMRKPSVNKEECEHIEAYNDYLNCLMLPGQTVYCCECHTNITFEDETKITESYIRNLRYRSDTTENETESVKHPNLNSEGTEETTTDKQQTSGTQEK